MHKLQCSPYIQNKDKSAKFEHKAELTKHALSINLLENLYRFDYK